MRSTSQEWALIDDLYDRFLEPKGTGSSGGLQDAKQLLHDCVTGLRDAMSPDFLRDVAIYEPSAPSTSDTPDETILRFVRFFFR